MKDIDILCVGELLIDLISEGFSEELKSVDRFVRLQGGSPANLCMNMARLGGNTALVASVGQDDMGDFLLDGIVEMGLAPQYIQRVVEPTTLILITRSKEVSDFEVYRGADAQIGSNQLADDLLKRCKIFHTTCFALSRMPAQENILLAAKRASQYGTRLSIDANYAQKVWPDREQAMAILAQYCAMGAVVKVSEVDWARLYQSELKDPLEAVRHFIELGAAEVCVTLGGEGCYVGDAKEQHFLPARRVEVKDTTGAGDAFWSGYLTARLDDYGLLAAAQAGRRMAEIKLGHFGPLPGKMEREVIYK